MFIKSSQLPEIEFNPSADQAAPTLVHYFSDRADPFKSSLALLVEAAKNGDECVIVVESPLSEIADRAIWLNQHPDISDRAVIDVRQRPFFEAVKASLAKAIEKIDMIEFVALDEDEDVADD